MNWCVYLGGFALYKMYTETWKMQSHSGYKEEFLKVCHRHWMWSSFLFVSLVPDLDTILKMYLDFIFPNSFQKDRDLRSDPF